MIEIIMISVFLLLLIITVTITLLIYNKYQKDLKIKEKKYQNEINNIIKNIDNDYDTINAIKMKYTTKN